jgi:hypothetical protein
MLRTFGRLLMFKVLPRRLLPLLTVVEVAQLLRAARRRRAGAGARATAGRSANAGPTPNDRWRDAFDAHRERTSSVDPGR